MKGNYKPEKFVSPIFFKLAVFLMFTYTFLFIIISVVARPTLKKLNQAHIDEVSRKELNDYLEKISNEFSKYPEFNIQADVQSADWRKQIIEFISARPELGRRLDLIKHKETVQLHSLLGAINDESKTEEEKYRVLSKIAQKEGYLAHGEPFSFNAEDVAFLQRAVTEHIEDIDKTEHQIFQFESIRQRIKEWKEILEHKKTKEELMMEYFKRREKLRSKKVHEPGSREELEQIWKESDHQDGEFDPKIFFKLHDLNNDKMLDEEEIESLISKSISEYYDEGTRDYYHELVRTRIHFIKKVDSNRDKVVTEEELIKAYEDFTPENSWDPIDDDYEDEIGSLDNFDKEKIKKFMEKHKPTDPEALEYWNRAMSDLNEV